MPTSYSFYDLMHGMDVLSHADMYIQVQLSPGMSMQMVKDHFDTRAQLLMLSKRVLLDSVFLIGEGI